MASAYVGIGSNLGDRHRYVADAFAAMGALPHTQLVARSQIYETDPVGPPGQGTFLNAAAHLHTQLEPLDVLEHLRAIEVAADRVRGQKWGPRTLDLDLLLYDDRVIDLDELQVPHPMMHERWFVLKPLCDIGADAVHPRLGVTVAELLRELERGA